MKASRRLDRSVCGAVLSTWGVALAPLPPPTPSGRSCPLPRCTRSQNPQPKLPRRPGANWLCATDPAAGTLLPLLLPPPAWTAPRKDTVRGSRATPPTTPAAPRLAGRTKSKTRAVGGPTLASAVRGIHTSSALGPTAPEPPSGGPSDPTSSDLASPESTAYESTSGGPTEDTEPPPLRAVPPPPPPEFWRQNRPTESTKDLLSYVDPPAVGDSVDEHLDFIRDPYRNHYAPPADGPEVIVSQTREDAAVPSWEDLERADEAVQASIHELSRAVWARLRNPAKVSAAEVYDVYCQIPGARMDCVPASLRHQLLKALGMVEKKDAPSMLRYFAVVADVRDGGFALCQAEWNAAMSFASRYVGSSTATETEAAVNLWRQMEQEAHIRGNEVTFNILFDVASKAGNFTLAEMVYAEMERRGLRYNRYHHVSLIHFFGLKMDADGVRTAYQEMVEAGEMIDVVVLNCVMVGFLRCGEEDAAMRVYARMRQRSVDMLKKKKKKKTTPGATERTDDDVSSLLAIPLEKTAAAEEAQEQEQEQQQQQQQHEEEDVDDDNGTDIVPFPDLSGNLASQKAMTQVLMMLARVSRGDDAVRAGYQHLVSTRPDLATYRILVNHFAVRLGDLATVTCLLSDMQTLRIPLHGAIFLALFKGFALHGGRNGTGADWSEQRLRSIWAALLRALDDKAEGLYISTWLIVWGLRAVDRCSATPEAVFKAYNALTSRWTPSEADADFAIGFLHNLLKGARWHRPGHGSNSSSSYGGGGRSVLGQLGHHRHTYG